MIHSKLNVINKRVLQWKLWTEMTMKGYHIPLQIKEGKTYVQGVMHFKANLSVRIVRS